ncbi:MAG: alpha/beta hydrolase [Pseudomonadota bacterium]|jgi:alpha-beta hydrolase superfamily lysophospholipase|nr:alpha/beta hydrolase [Xanthomonadaceae bacterium]MDE2247023.1 alpha/beta hydrolase [Xanthomonadaceae bacterium]MDE3209781.1 alpha/beta hydrolase [Pseudomonadota bacterium]
MNARPSPTQPCQFGTGGDLFGIYHAATGHPKRAVLLCPPLGQEMVRSHRIYRQLGDALALQGCAVLRFDYYGSGDSAGASNQLDWTRCVSDAVTAAAELRRRSGCDRLLGFGARLGGAIALESADDAGFAELLLWDPILDGSAHVARLDAMQDALWRDGDRFSQPRTAADAANQWLGFPIGPALKRQLGHWRAGPAKVPVALLDSQPPAPPGQPAGALDATIRRLQTAIAWDDLERLEHAVLSPELIRAVVDHVRGSA